MTINALQLSLDDESFAKFLGCLVTMFGGYLQQLQALMQTKTKIIEESREKLSKIPDSDKIINKQGAHINILEA